MINKDFLLFVLLLFFIAAIYYKVLYYFDILLNKIFPESGEKVDTQYVCPKCGSTNWKFADPLKPSEHMINLPQLVNTLYECKDCDNIGTFFKIDKNDVDNVKLIDNETKLLNNKDKFVFNKRAIFSIMATFIIVGFFTSLIVALACSLFVANYYKNQPKPL